MDQDIIKHRHSLSSWHTVRLDREGIRTVLVVETDLAVRPDDADFNADAFNELTTEIRNYLATHDDVDSADVHRIK